MKKEFNIGDEVVSLSNTTNSNSQLRIEGKKYIVMDAMYCPTCGAQCINIGGVAKYRQVKCGCGDVQDSRGKSWTNSTEFSKVNHIEKEMLDAVKIENYEEAAVLRDIMKVMNA